MSLLKSKTEFYKDESDEWRWRTTSTNNNKIANSGEGYKNKEDAWNGFWSSQNTPVVVRPQLSSYDRGAGETFTYYHYES